MSRTPLATSHVIGDLGLTAAVNAIAQRANDHDSDITALSVTEIVIPASALLPASATAPAPVMGFLTGGLPVVLLDGTVTGIVAAQVDVPSDWATYNVDVTWANAGSATGDVVWRFDKVGGQLGAALSTIVSAANVTVTALAQDFGIQTRVAAAVAVSTNQVRGIRIVRFGALSADTHTGLVGIAKVTLTRAS